MLEYKCRQCGHSFEDESYFGLYTYCPFCEGLAEVEDQEPWYVSFFRKMREIIWD